MTTFTVLGAGWLGKPLALHLHNLGHTVYASRTSSQGVKELDDLGLNGFVASVNTDANDLPDTCSSLGDTLALQGCEVLVVCFPPGTRSEDKGRSYAVKWENLTDQLKTIAHLGKSSVRKVIMISTTSVYPSPAQEYCEEDANLNLAENSELFSASAKRILTAEQHLIDSKLEYGIIRCSGLIGPDRHPARFVRHLKTVSRQAPANMIHLDDVIGVIKHIADWPESTIVNATSPETTNKAHFYQAALESIQSQLPTYSEPLIHAEQQLPSTTDTTDKRILANKLVEMGYQFIYPHTLAALEAIPVIGTSQS